MAYTELGDDSKVKLKIPTKGTTNWDEELKTNTFQKIVDHDHTAVDGKGSKITTAAITDLNVTNAKLEADAITQDKIADNAVQVEHKKTYTPTLDASPKDLNTGLASGQSFIINYKIKDGSNYQVGTLSGISNSFLIDEFVGSDLEFTFDFNGNDIEINGASGKELTYSIEFLE